MREGFARRGVRKARRGEEMEEEEEGFAGGRCEEGATTRRREKGRRRRRGLRGGGVRKAGARGGGRRAGGGGGHARLQSACLPSWTRRKIAIQTSALFSLPSFSPSLPSSNNITHSLFSSSAFPIIHTAATPSPRSWKACPRNFTWPAAGTRWVALRPRAPMA